MTGTWGKVKAKRDAIIRQMTAAAVQGLRHPFQDVILFPRSHQLDRIQRAVAAVLAAALTIARLDWAALSGGTHLDWTLLGNAALGAGAYVAALWMLLGRPAGAEADLLDLARRVVGRIMRRLAPTRLQPDPAEDVR